MNEHDRKIFEEIKAQSEKDKDLWRAYNEQEETTWHIDEKLENEIMERMFLVYFVEKYLELVDKNSIL